MTALYFTRLFQGGQLIQHTGKENVARFITQPKLDGFHNVKKISSSHTTNGNNSIGYTLKNNCAPNLMCSCKHFHSTQELTREIGVCIL